MDSMKDVFAKLSLNPIEMVLHCPACGTQHIDAADEATGWTNPPHRSHLCATCGHVWRVADVCTTGVAKLHSAGKADGPPVTMELRLIVTRAVYHGWRDAPDRNWRLIDKARELSEKMP